MNEIKIFENSEFGSVRTVEENGNVLFCGFDVAKALGYARPNDAISSHCRATVKHSTLISGKMQEINYIPEGDVYRLITHSKLPSAERFEHWVFDDVLPSIRKHGTYMTDSVIEQALTDPDFLIKLATELKTEREKRKALEVKAEQDKSKVLFADAVATAKTSILIGDLAKIIKQNGVEIGQKRLFEWLRINGYLMKSGTSFNMPTQMAMEKKLFEIKESTINNPDGSIRVTRTTKVTGVGQEYFVNKFLGTCNGQAVK
jgi:anti-repressor protein